MVNQLKTIETIDTSPFKHMIMTIGELPTSYVESMTYYELLGWLANYVEKTVDPAINNNAEALQELQDYVAHYFDNLDVQEEINNKLDEMANDGTLTSLIKSYIDPLFAEQNEDINEFKEEIRDDIAEINSAVTALGSGSPIPVSSTDDMTDTTKIYVLTTSGNWYYYDGDSWEIGGSYQSSSISNGSIDILKLDDNLQSNFVLNFGEAMDLGDRYAGYYKEDGTLVNDNNYANYHISLTAGKIYCFTGRNKVLLVGLVVMDNSNNVIFATGNGGVTANVSATFKCNANNLTAYISIDTTANEKDLKNVPVLREATGLYNALKYSSTVPLVKTISGYVNSTYTAETYSRVQVTTDENTVTKMYQMIKGRTYLISSYNTGKLVGYSIVDEDFTLLEASSTSTVTPPVQVGLTYTAQDNGYIFTSEYTGSTTASVTIVDYGITIPMPNILTGKKLCVTGDSICAGAGYSGGYAGIIALNNQMTVQNIAVGGGTIASGTTASGGANRFWINESITSLDSDADYILIQGGGNDSSLGVTMGTITEGYGSSFDSDTFIGAFENMCYQLTKRFKGKKYGYVFNHQWTNNFRHSNTDQSTSYYWQAKKVLEKWCIPYVDLNIECPPFAYFNQSNADLYAIRTEYTKDGDGVHPNEAGYKKYYVDKITSFLKSL